MKNTTILGILMGLITAICTCNFLKPSHELNITPVSTDIALQKAMEKRGKEIEKSFALKMDSLEKRCDSLQLALNESSQDLKIAKGKTLVLQTKVQTLVAKDNKETDTIKRLANCDSIKDQVSSLITNHQQQDSLCEGMIQQMGAVIHARSEEVKTCKEDFNALQEELDQSLEQQQKLTDDLNKATKKLKRQAFGNKLLSAGAAILAGTLTTTLLVNKKL